jgi:RNA polymerase sigma factor (sigma-70 family)
MGAQSPRLALVRSPPDNRSGGEPRSDSAYIAAVHQADETLFTELVRTYLAPLTRFAYGCTGDEDAAHDIVQEVFARIWQLGADWNPTHGVAAYLFTAVRHRAYNVIHADHARHRMQQAVRLESYTAATERDPYLDLSLVALVRRELQQLTDRQRDVLRLRYEQGHTMPQVAKILGVEVRAAEKLIARALTTLRTRLSDLREKL